MRRMATGSPLFSTSFRTTWARKRTISRNSRPDAPAFAVILDVVYNHLGPEGNYLAKFGPYFTNRYHTPWGDAVNLDDADSDEVRRFFCDNALMWLRDYRVDGLRVDAIHAIFDASAIPFLEQLGVEVHDLEAEV